MNTVSFEMRQAHLAAFRFASKTTSLVGLTPARLNIIRTLLERPGHSVLQSNLHHLLGVSRTVISIMVRALEKLGFLTRRPSLKDRRTFVLEPTPLAERALRRVHLENNVFGYLPLAFSSTLGERFAPPADWELQFGQASLVLRKFRDGLGRGESYNPWDVNEDDYGLLAPRPEEDAIAFDLLDEEEEVEWRDQLERLDQLAEASKVDGRQREGLSYPP